MKALITCSHALLIATLSNQIRQFTNQGSFALLSLWKPRRRKNKLALVSDLLASDMKKDISKIPRVDTCPNLGSVALRKPAAAAQPHGNMGMCGSDCINSCYLAGLANLIAALKG